MISHSTIAQLRSQYLNHFIFLHWKQTFLGKKKKRNLIPCLDLLVKRSGLIWLIFQESRSCPSKPFYSFHEERQNCSVVRTPTCSWVFKDITVSALYRTGTQAIQVQMNVFKTQINGWETRCMTYPPFIWQKAGNSLWQQWQYWLCKLKVTCKKTSSLKEILFISTSAV